MTIKRARELLGKRGESLTDEQILKMVSLLAYICNKAIDQVISDKTK